MSYNYDIFRKNVDELKRLYSFLDVGIIGYSILGKEIPYIKIGRGERQVLYHGSIHANEWITSVLLMKFIENFCRAYISNSNIYGYSAQNLFNKASLYIIPMVNPDGVDLVTGNIDKNSSTYQNYVYLSKFYPSIAFPNGWKANFNGVDLNLQFPAGWRNARNIKFSQGFTKPGPRDFVGAGPLTQREAIAH